MLSQKLFGPAAIRTPVGAVKNNLALGHELSSIESPIKFIGVRLMKISKGSNYFPIALLFFFLCNIPFHLALIALINAWVNSTVLLSNP
jgi:hypothetical protein